jgi:predicted negative regulator of RcsB-dependent stress response
MEHKDPQFEESHGEVRGWFQENLRVIVSIFIVAAIALGIYSYSRHANFGRHKRERLHI